MYSETTQGILIEAQPQFVADESKPDEGYYYFSYKIRITNRGEKPAQLISRHWIIKDGTGDSREVRGDGVIGKQPLLEPGQSFEYTSFCPLPTPTGNMRGSYLMVDATGESFEAKIPLFFLRQSL